MSRRGRNNRSFARQMGLDLHFFDAATRRAMLDSAAMEVEASDVTYSSLEVAIDALKLPDSDPNASFDLTIHDTDKKLDANKLGEPTKKLICEAAQHSTTVQQFISDRTKQANDPDFPSKLRFYFLSLYNKFYEEEGVYGDALFEAVRQAASASVKTASCKFATLAVLVHLFIICDVFLRPEEV